MNKAMKVVRKLLMPYGIWYCADGREVLFTRGYSPLWQRIDGQVSKANRREYVKDILGQGLFYDDWTPEPAKIAAAGRVLKEWGLLVPTLDDLRAFWPDWDDPKHSVARPVSDYANYAEWGPILQ
jgi:hypothetical protein